MHAAVPARKGSLPWRTRLRAFVVRRPLLTLVILLLSAVVFWRLYADRRFWVAAIEQRTLSPEYYWPGASFDEPVDAEDLAAFRRLRRPAFDLEAATIPLEEIHSGGPPKDGIPALTNPQLIAGRDATYLRPNDRVIGFVVESAARAYPLKILNYHEIVNDQMGKVPYAITYCPLCDSAAVFDRRTSSGQREFGVSGLLYNSNVLMYDRTRDTESLWSQLQARGVSGPGADMSLETLPVELTTWAEWLTRFPDTKVLSPETGHARDYERNPYAGYFARPDLMFGVKATSDALPPKARVLGVWTEDAARAYPESAFSRERARIEDSIGGRRIVVEYHPDAQSLRVVDAGEGVRWMYALWFAWHAFHPEGDVFQ